MAKATLIKSGLDTTSTIIQPAALVQAAVRVVGGLEAMEVILMGPAIDQQRLLGRGREARSLNPLLATGGGGRTEAIGSGQSRVGQGIEARGEVPQVEEDRLAMDKEQNKLKVSFQQSSIH